MALASQYEQMRDYALAAETLRKALELQPDNAEMKRALRAEPAARGQYDEALKCTTKSWPTTRKTGSLSFGFRRSIARRKIS